MRYKTIMVCASIIIVIFVETQCHARGGFAILLANIASLQNNDDTRYTMIILPFQNNTDVPTAADSADDLLRSELIKTGYFKVIERGETFETIVEFAPGDNFYIGGYKFNDTSTSVRQQDTDSTRKTKRKGKVGWLDMPFRLERHTIIKFAEKLDADFAIAGGMNQFGEKIRVDIELIGAKCSRTLASLTADAESFERLPDIVNSLTLDVTKACRSANAQHDTNNIVSRYKQGLYTYEVTIQKLGELSSIIPDSLAPPVSLLSIYLELPGMEEEIIATGERILTLFDPQQNEHLEILQSMGIDPFEELAKAYEKKGTMDKVIETHSKAIKICPINTLAHYKELALAYKVKGMEQQHIETLQNALLVCKTDPDVYYYLGAAMEKNGKLEQAIEYYRKCLKHTNEALLISEIRSKLSQMESTD
ncbi:MAG TPA: tetratricopeptide repeat protein [Candidatus Brocadiia bacterium]|nr:tetratricopeptide repeat protein [Planctomycetota bacterium]MDO8092796.1 tetratricopeptide repeat protein [Candidatus Brocadiales bacterium]